MPALDDLVRMALLTALVVVIWKWHINRHPWVNCDKCKGRSKEQHLGLTPFGHCSRCGGAGKRRRFGAWLLGHPKVGGK